MSSTKIINVLKDDSFQEIIDLFKATPAEEVIFVLPKRSRAFQKEDHFAALRAEAKGLNKAVSFLCSSPELNEMAKKHHFDVLLARAPAPRKTAKAVKANSINVVNQIEDFYSEPATSPDSISIAQTAMEEEPEFQEESVGSRRLEDVVVPEDKNHHNIKVSGKPEKHMAVEVRQAETDTEHRALDEIKSVWGAPFAAPEIKTAGASWTSWMRRRSPNKRSLGRGPGHRIGLVALACAAVIVLGTVIFISTGKAEVTIKPTEESLDLRLTVTASDNISSVDPVTMSLPGQVFNIQKSVTKNFPATGHVDVAQKARGTITVHNELAVNQPLVATTRFESADHHIFHTLTSVVVPAGKTIDVQVIATKAGSDYNVPAGTFTIPAFQERGDTTKFQKVYGKSVSPMHSGTGGKSTVATESDLATAKQALTIQLTANIKDELSSQVKELKVLENTEVSVGQFTSNPPIDAAATTFSAQLAGSLVTVGFKQSDLDSLIAKYVDTQKNKKVLPEKLQLTYENVRWDDAKDGLVFDVRVKGPGYTKIDQQRIAKEILGKNDDQIRAYLGGITGIQEANVSLSPFWVRSIPRSQDKVQVDLSY